MLKKIEFKALFLIFVIIVQLVFFSFSAVVSDNDGTAFISKAEFDTLNNSFQSQINTYNAQIDNKIDDAIASYLAGMKSEVTSVVNLHCPVNELIAHKPKMVKNKTNTIKKQTFQSGLYYTMHWAEVGNLPHTAADRNPWDNPTQHNFSQFAYNCNGYYDQMEGWVFDSTNHYVLTNKYNYDNCQLILNDLAIWNANIGYPADKAERFSMGIAPGTITGKRINVNYDDTTGIGNGSAHWVCGTSDWLTINNTNVKNNWCDVLPISDAFANSQARQRNTTQYDENVLRVDYCFTHSSKNEDNNIYLYPECHDVIYAYKDGEETLEEYRDIMTDVDSADVIGGEYTNLYISEQSSAWMYYRGEQDGDGGDGYYPINPKRIWRFLPKFKLKNTSTVVRPNTASVSGGTKYWNTLDQFLNGKLKYTNNDNEVAYPHFYGGLPLVSIDSSSNYVKFTFDVKISPTITSSVNNLCIRVMSEEFPNGNDISTWTESKKNALQKITGSSKTGDIITNYAYNNTLDCLVIPKNKEVTITIDKPAKNKTYFIRWWEEGNANSAGGQIELLGNGKVTKESK